MARPIKDLTGKRFDRLTVTGISEQKSKDGSYLWNCICDCGNQVTRTSRALRDKGYSSCGKCERKAESGNFLYGYANVIVEILA